jgi:hypothetical protein
MSRFMLAGAVVLVAACSAPTSPTGVPSSDRVRFDSTAPVASQHGSEHASAAKADHAANPGRIDGWFEGKTVSLHYVKAFFCAEPPASEAPTSCEVGAAPQVTPRPAGPFPTIYAIAAAGISPDPTTLACAAGSACLNHPGMIDLSRVGGLPSAPPVAHSHIVTERRGGWFNTVNIRVRNLAAWNQIAAAKTLDKVRQLQADPALVDGDKPTNIYFFIASWD